ncbi:hypothetical protein DS884_14140 [Tenacibaculum sp. E3R01]|uniref:hypothetical protein n=1 Tax=Tenacibaculum sp. E3R01 TaxID=2267227 RepID=UPI000DEBEBB5|nr:hypothetical protein [Tenacibaculum sp. E3R01]RBW56598.1 hypothetical protein DS884_14140 [Tenacibaculum sp. E3R01]
MTTNNQSLNSKKKILKSLILAFFIASIVLLVAVLPAEYGIDPLGTGKLFGFSKLHKKEVEMNTTSASSLNFNKITLDDVGSSSDIIKPIEANNAPPEKQLPKREDVIKVIVPAKKGIEYKVKMLKYGSMKYEWSTTDQIVFTDFHGEVKQDNPPKDVFYESYTVAYSNNMGGTLTAPFEGKHGWYFKNLIDNDVVVVIKLKGEYELFN